jgi:hypothetical protein
VSAPGLVIRLAVKFVPPRPGWQPAWFAHVDGYNPETACFEVLLGSACDHGLGYGREHTIWAAVELARREIRERRRWRQLHRQWDREDRERTEAAP